MEWKRFSEFRPKGPSQFGFMVILEGSTTPIQGQFDAVSKRFYVFCPQIGKSIQAPVKWWLEVPVLLDV